jgi:hypothetical protein
MFGKTEPCWAIRNLPPDGLTGIVLRIGMVG